MLLQASRLFGCPAVPMVVRQILPQPNDELGFHGREPGREDADLDRGSLLLAMVTLLSPDWADKPVRVSRRAPPRRDVADLPADQLVLPSRHRQLLDLVGLGHAGGHSPGKPREAPTLASGSHQCGCDIFSWRCAHLDLSGAFTSVTRAPNAMPTDENSAMAPPAPNLRARGTR